LPSYTSRKNKKKNLKIFSSNKNPRGALAPIFNYSPSPDPACPTRAAQLLLFSVRLRTRQEETFGTFFERRGAIATSIVHTFD
jgi:hypothetical protein